MLGGGCRLRSEGVCISFRRHALLPAILAGSLVATLIYRAPAGAAGAHRAGVVVRGDDGTVHSACVSFDQPSISGLSLLERSGLDVNVQTSGGGAAVCSIAGQGCHFPSEACFCQCQGGGPCRYWTYWHLGSGTWQYAAAGAASYQVPPGGVDGWAWGDSVGASGPPPASFDTICSLPKTVPFLVTATTATTAPSPPGAPVLPPEAQATAVAASTPNVHRPIAAPYLIFGSTLLALAAAALLAARRRR